MIYLAGSCSSSDRTMMKNLADRLRQESFEVYCPFEYKVENAWDYSQEEWAQKVFDYDIAMLDKSDTFVMITPGRNSTAGTNWEQGYAYAKNKNIFVFQYTQDETSLMSYCGSKIYYVTCKKKLEDDVIFLLLNHNVCEGKGECPTVLT